MPKKVPDDTLSFEEARAALLASLERAHELVTEAKQVIGTKEEAETRPPNPAG